MNRALLQQALDFCVFCWRDVDMNDYTFERLETTIDALSTELAKPEPEPVAWRSWHDTYGVGYWDTFDEAELNCAEDAVPEALFTKETK